jgi:hypothetical protein
LFERLIDPKVVINDITPLGSKTNVIKACQNDTDSRKNKIYIVDGDLDLIYDNNPKRIANLFVLDSYCIENYLIEETGIILFMHKLDGEKSKSQIKLNLDFGNWINFNTCLIDLFIHYSIMKELSIDYSIISLSKLTKSSRQGAFLDQKKVINLVKALKFQIITSKSEKEYKRLIKSRAKKWKNDHHTFLKIISGKDFLLPLLEFKIKCLCNSANLLMRRKAIKVNLASYCSLERLKKLKRAIER